MKKKMTFEFILHQTLKNKIYFKQSNLNLFKVGLHDKGIIVRILIITQEPIMLSVIDNVVFITRLHAMLNIMC